MIIPVGQTATASAGVEIVTDHYCPHCRAVSQAIAVGTGDGAPGFGSDVAEAVAHARNNAQLDAARAVKLARCPRCGRRDGAEVRRFLVGSLVSGTLIGAGAGVLAFLFTLSSGYALAAVGAGLAGGALRFVLKLRRSDQVYFTPPGE
jgi:hypothetical protein